MFFETFRKINILFLWGERTWQNPKCTQYQTTSEEIMSTSQIVTKSLISFHLA